MTLPTTSQSEIFREHPLIPKSFCEKHFGCCYKKKTHKRGPTIIEMEEEQKEQTRIVDAFAIKKLKSYDNE